MSPLPATPFPSHPTTSPRRIPRSVEVELYDDLVDVCVPGDVVTVCGEVKVVSTEEGKGKQDQCMFLLYIEASSLVG